MPLTYSIDWDDATTEWPYCPWLHVDVPKDKKRTSDGKLKTNKKRIGDVLTECLGDAVTAFNDTATVASGCVEEFVDQWLWDRLWLVKQLNALKITRKLFCAAIMKEFNNIRNQKPLGKRDFCISLGVVMEGSRLQYILDDCFEETEYTFEIIKTKIEDSLSKWSVQQGMKTRKGAKDCFVIVNQDPAPFNQETMNAAMVVGAEDEDPTDWLNVYLWVDAKGLATGQKPK